jgi:hypothetical protein
VRRTFEQGKNLLLQSSGLTEEAYGILKCVARYPAELVRIFLTTGTVNPELNFHPCFIRENLWLKKVLNQGQTRATDY